MDIPTISKQEALSLYKGNGAALARALGVSRQYIHSLEDGQLPETMALKFRFLVRPDAFTSTGTVKKSLLKAA